MPGFLLMEKVYDLAARTLIINLQRAIRDTEYQFAKSLVKSPVKRKAAEMGLGFADPAKAFATTMRSVESMSEEQRLELLNQLQALAGRKKR